MLGLINSKATQALTQIDSMSPLQIDVYAPDLEIRSILSFKSSNKARKFKVNIDIYVARSACDEVGRVLSNHSLHLQDPITNRLQLEYINPQVLEFSSLADNDIRTAKDALLLTSGESKAGPLSWSSVLGHLPYHNAESVYKDNSRLETKLLRYVQS